MNESWITNKPNKLYLKKEKKKYVKNNLNFNSHNINENSHKKHWIPSSSSVYFYHYIFKRIVFITFYCKYVIKFYSILYLKYVYIQYNVQYSLFKLKEKNKWRKEKNEVIIWNRKIYLISQKIVCHCLIAMQGTP